jgi:hypothetical protein
VLEVLSKSVSKWGASRVLRSDNGPKSPSPEGSDQAGQIAIGGSSACNSIVGWIFQVQWMIFHFVTLIENSRIIFQP